MSETVHVNLPGRAYDIVVGEGLLATLGRRLGALAPFGRVAVVSDETVWGLYGEEVLASLAEARLEASAVVLPGGEASKSLAGLGRVYDALCDAGMHRDGLLLALGGGVVGDLAGFAAATYLRGVDFVQLPTTLLAQVDSSVGGKTAINLPRGKNLAGAFYQPRLVLADTACFASLPRREWACGMAEVIKYGALYSPELFAALETPPPQEEMGPIVARCCEMKRDVVLRDERDRGERALLNLGHTLGHAVEACGGFERWNHGEGVAIGMVLAASIGEALGLTEGGTAAALTRVLAASGLPTACPCPRAELLQHAAMDKKAAGDGVAFVLLRRIGEAFVHKLGFNELDGLLREVGVS